LDEVDSQFFSQADSSHVVNSQSFPDAVDSQTCSDVIDSQTFSDAEDSQIFLMLSTFLGCGRLSNLFRCG
jgi:hypothetical protein